MRLVTFRQQNRTAPGLLIDGERVLDLSRSLPGKGVITSLLELVRAGGDGEAAIREAAKDAGAGAGSNSGLALKEVRLLAPIPWPRKNVFCVGRNYVEHVAEGFRARGTEMKLPEFAQFFTKPATAVIGPEDKSLEVQIRSSAMHAQAELGVAAHWRY